MDSDKHKVYLSIGSNHENCSAFVQQAAERLKSTLSDWKMCHPYKTKAINGLGADYLNAVAVGNWLGDKESLNKICKSIELDLGRTHDRMSHSVEIDIDIVCFDGEVLRPVDYSREYFSKGFNELLKDC
ncbi:MAG: 2-amino-4-hydroxy-6-hydroxymethyldihydropteridine diphosphokinase [Bacteroidales bacterium]|nr:2-amino-4-hydroxy-6-hydroxymethyldihydropteridine diphosphokinase [Bacteroidales bacterium]